MNINLENIERFTIPLEEYLGNWIFMDTDEKLPSKEFKDQIHILNPEASQFLWDYEMNTKIICTENYFNELSFYNSADKNQKEIKKYLYNLGIPFSNKVFMVIQPHRGYYLTWKMVVKFSHQLFFYEDQSVWDRSLNWRLEYHHDGEFAFGKGIKNKL